MNYIANLKTVILGLILMLLAFPLPVSSQDSELSPVTVDKIPGSLEEFIALRNKLAITSQGGATVMIIACIIYTRDSELGEKCLVIAVANDLLVKGQIYKGYALSYKDKKFIEDHIGKDSGADSPRPITLTRNNKGIWKASSWHSLLVTIKAPLFQDDL